MPTARRRPSSRVRSWIDCDIARRDSDHVYLPPTEVLNALPGTWHGITSQAGWRTWLTARRIMA